MNHITVAESICQRNQGLVTYVHENPETSYKGVRQSLQRVISAISTKYNEGKFVSKQDLHKLTWAVIDVANGDTDTELPAVEV